MFLSRIASNNSSFIRAPCIAYKPTHVAAVAVISICCHHASFDLNFFIFIYTAIVISTRFPFNFPYISFVHNTRNISNTSSFLKSLSDITRSIVSHVVYTVSILTFLCWNPLVPLSQSTSLCLFATIPNCKVHDKFVKNIAKL